MTGRTAILAGATGLVGREILAALLAEPSVAEVHTLGRRAPAVRHPRLFAHIVDFEALPALPAADDVYLALGTTIKLAGSQAAFRAVDHDATLAVAEAALAAGAKRFGLVSAMGADASSKVFYNRVKGEVEQALIRMPLDALVIARPSLLVGDRAALAQAPRPGEQWGIALIRTLGWLVPENYLPIEAAAVARALVSAVPVANRTQTLLSGAMRRAWQGRSAQA